MFAKIRQFLSRYKKLAAALLGVSGLACFASLGAQIGPPWPTNAATASFVSLVNGALVTLIYFTTRSKTSVQTITNRIVRCFIGLVAAVVAYITLQAMVCYETTDWQHRVAGGLVLRPEIAAVLQADPTLSVEQVLREAHYHATEIWEPWSVYVVRIVTLLSWIVVFCLFSAVIAYAIAK